MTLALDGTGTNTFSGASSGTVTLTTTHTDDIIVVFIANETNAANTYATVSSITDTAGLTWNKRVQYETPNSVTNSLIGEVWWAHASGTLSADTITIHLSRTVDDASILAFGVNGANTSSPWDTSKSLPGLSTNGNTNLGVPITTLGHDTFLLAFEFHGGSQGSTDLVTPWTNLGTVNNNGGALASSAAAWYQIVSTAQSNTNVGFTAVRSATGMITDAIVAASTTIDGSTVCIDGVGSQCSSVGGATWTPDTYLTTQASNTGLVVACIFYESTGASLTISGITDTSGLTWSKYTSFTITDDGHAWIDVWYAAPTSQVVNDRLTIAFSGGSCDDAVLSMFGVSDASGLTSFDSDSPVSAQGASGDPAITISTAGTTSLLFLTAGAVANNGTYGSNSSPVFTGYNVIGSGNTAAGGRFASMQTVVQKFTSAQSGITPTSGTALTNWGMVGFAIVPGLGTPGTLGATEDADALGFSGYPNPIGTLDITEAADTAIFANPPHGSLDVTEAPDSTDIEGYLSILATLDVTEPVDTSEIHAYPIGSLSPTESKDVASFAGWVMGLPITGRLRSAESADGFAGSNISAIAGAMAVTESADSHASAGYELPFGSPPVPQRRRVQIVT